MCNKNAQLEIDIEHSPVQKIRTAWPDVVVDSSPAR